MPISDCEVRDPRMRRTRRLLQGALGQLMHSKGFDEITVQDITEEATVNRATFYDHYADKYALLEAMVGSEFHQLLEERQVRFEGHCASQAAAVIRATCDYLSQVHSQDGSCTRQSAFEPLMDAALTLAIRRVLVRGLAQGQDETPELRAAAVSAAIFGAAKEWLRTPKRVPAEEIVPWILGVITPMLTNRPEVPLAMQK